MKKALVYASVASMIQQFNMDNIRLLKELGYEVDVGCNTVEGSSISTEAIADMIDELEGMGVKTYHIPIPRKIFAVGEIIRSCKITKKLMNEQNYDLVHCHSPIGAMVCRVANRISRNYKNTRMIYTAHGFHFYKGASKLNWLLFYPVEKILSYFTDVLITINKEDYSRAQRKMRAGKIEYVRGIGITPSRFAPSEKPKDVKRKELGIPKDALVLLSVGELNENKNHSLVIDALSGISDDRIHYVIAGQGALYNKLLEKANKSGISERFHLLGYRNDISELYSMADIFVFPSFREGLSVSVMEAMTSGIACVVSRIRGNTDLVDENGGALFDPSNAEDCRIAVEKVIAADRDVFGSYNKEKIKPFFIDGVMAEMRRIYSEC